LSTAWKGVSSLIQENDLSIRETIQKFEKTIFSIIQEIDSLSSTYGVDFILQTDYINIVEQIENFFEEFKPLG
jgi:hypothetical protein